MDIKKITGEFKQIVQDPITYLKNIKDREIIGYTCSYVPEEIILGFDFHPARIMGSKMSYEKAQAHLQPYACPTAKSILEDLLLPDLPMKYIIFANTCDTMQRLSDIFRLNSNGKISLDFMVPTKLTSDPSQNYFYTITYNFYQKIKQLANKEENIKEAISVLNKIRRLIQEIQMLFPKQDVLTNEDLYYIYVAGMIMEKDKFLEKLHTILSFLKQNTTKELSNKRVIVTGSMCFAPFIYRILDQLGACVVYNDMCSGMRPYKRYVENTNDIIKSIVESFLSRPICASKHMNLYSRINYLNQLIDSFNASHIIYLVPKFCDPQCFDFPDIRNSCKLPILFLEIEHRDLELGPEKTRIEAFLESL